MAPSATQQKPLESGIMLKINLEAKILQIAKNHLRNFERA